MRWALICIILLIETAFAQPVFLAYNQNIPAGLYPTTCFIKGDPDCWLKIMELPIITDRQLNLNIEYLPHSSLNFFPKYSFSTKFQRFPLPRQLEPDHGKPSADSIITAKISDSFRRFGNYFVEFDANGLTAGNYFITLYPDNSDMRSEVMLLK